MLRAVICHFLKYVFIIMSNYFWYHLRINSDGIRLCEGQMNTHVVHTSHPGCALCISHMLFTLVIQAVLSVFLCSCGYHVFPALVWSGHSVPYYDGLVWAQWSMLRWSGVCVCVCVRLWGCVCAALLWRGRG